MSAHKQFFAFLDAIPGGTDWKNALIQYKTNENEIAFKLNGHMRGCIPSDELAPFGQRLRSAILAHNTAPFVVYRMTTIAEFSTPAVPVHQQNAFPYLAFMSTTGTLESLHTFVQNHDAPLLLEIECPEGSPMALMEGGEFGLEDEYLLGCGTRFRLLKVDCITDPTKFEIVEWNAPHKQMFKAQLRIEAGPKYTEGKATFKFDPTANAAE